MPEQLTTGSEQLILFLREPLHALGVQVTKQQKPKKSLTKAASRYLVLSFDAAWRDRQYSRPDRSIPMWSVLPVQTFPQIKDS